MTTKHDQLRKTVDSIINQDTDAAVAAFVPYVQAMTREILGYAEKTDLNGAVPEVQDQDTTIGEGTELDKVTPSIRIVGDKVLVDSKEVGAVSHDIVNNPDEFTFIPNSGEGEQTFTSTEALFKWVKEKFLTTHN